MPEKKWSDLQKTFMFSLQISEHCMPPPPRVAPPASIPLPPPLSLVNANA